MDREEAAKELMAMLEEAQESPYYSEEEVRAHLLEILAPRNQVYMTGDLFRYRNKSPYLDVRIIPIDAIKQRK